MQHIWHKLQLILLSYRLRIKYWWRGRTHSVSSTLVQDRLNTCQANECGLLKYNICTGCGCPVKSKVLILTETCPENMWAPAVYKYRNRLYIDLDEVPTDLRNHFLQTTGWRSRSTREPTLVYYPRWEEFLSKLQPRE